jgi:hypothetical protein
MHIISYNCTINYTQDHCNNVKVTQREFPVTPQHDKKRNFSDITISPSSAEAKPKHTKAGSPMMSGILNR